MATSHLNCTSCYQEFTWVLVMQPEGSCLLFVLLPPSLAPLQTIPVFLDFPGKFYLGFLSKRLLKMLRAELASSLRFSVAFNPPVDCLFKWVPASFTTRLSPGGFFACCSCSLTDGADLAAAATWVQVFGPLEPRKVFTEIQLDYPHMSQGSIGIPLGRLWTVEVAT